jgi:hypothetical protein
LFATPRARERAFAVVLVVCALAPYLVLVATRVGHSYTPEGDNGTIDLRVRDVWSLHPPLVGPYSTFGWNHPGPLLFYALAIPSLVSGFAAWGTQVGGALLQGLAVAWLAWLAWRRGRLPLLAVSMVGVGLLALATNPFVVRNPWNPYVPLPFFALFVFQAWLVATGEARALVGATVVATFIVQTHVGYAPLVLAASLVGVACVLFDRRRGTTSDLRWGRALVWSVAIGFILWLPPIVDLVLHPPGNLRVVARYFIDPGRSVLPRLGLEQGARLMATEFAPVPPWLGGHGDLGFAAFPTGRSVLWLLVPAFLVTVGIVAARRRHDVAAVRFLLLAGVLVVAGCLAMARAEGNPFEYVFLWRSVPAIALALGTGWAVVAGTALTRGASRVVGAVAAVAVLVWGSLGLAVDVYHASVDDLPAERATASLSRQLLDHGVPSTGVLLRLQRSSGVQLMRGIHDELLRHDQRVFVDEDVGYQFGDGRAAMPADVGRVWWVADNGAAVAELSSRPGASEIASWSPLPPAQERRAREVSSRLFRQLEAIDRPDLVSQLNGPFFALLTAHLEGIDHRAAKELMGLNDRAARRGGPRSAIFSFAPAAAPGALVGG